MNKSTNDACVNSIRTVACYIVGCTILERLKSSRKRPSSTFTEFVRVAGPVLAGVALEAAPVLPV